MISQEELSVRRAWQRRHPWLYAGIFSVEMSPVFVLLALGYGTGWVAGAVLGVGGVAFVFVWTGLAKRSGAMQGGRSIFDPLNRP